MGCDWSIRCNYCTVSTVLFVEMKRWGLKEKVVCACDHMRVGTKVRTSPKQNILEIFVLF